MIADLAGLAIGAFTVFCRVGAAMMFVPGIGSARVPIITRLLVAIALSMALTPLLLEPTMSALAGLPEALRPFALINELAVGSFIGLTARFFLLALQFAATTAGNVIGLAGVPGQPIDETEALPPLTNLISAGGVMVMIATDLPEEVIRTVAASYDRFPIRVGLDVAWLAENLTRVAADTTLLGLRLAAPFIVYAVVVNIAMGLANKFTPQISMYFTSLGLVTFGGLIILYFSAQQLLHIFAEGAASWIGSN